VAQRRRGPSRPPSPGHLPRPPLRAAAVALGVGALAVGAYLVALETSVFTVRTIVIVGGSPQVQAEVRQALAPQVGRSLLRVSIGQIDAEVAPIPDVVSVHVNRVFPHTLHVVVRPEHGVLLVHQGNDSYVVSSLGRVMGRVFHPLRSALPRLWLKKSVPVSVGATLPLYDGRLAAAAVVPDTLGSFRGGVREVASSPSELTLVLATGAQVRLGDIGDLGLKLTIARRILQIAAARPGASGPPYVDVSVPERPVLGTVNTQLSGTG
jgi:cell division protein FtsQ